MASRRFQRDDVKDSVSPKDILKKAKGMDKDGDDKMGKVMRITLDRKENGWTSSTEHEPEKKDSGDMMGMGMRKTRDLVHPDKKSVMDHLSDCMED
jgi:hypothetical protein